MKQDDTDNVCDLLKRTNIIPPSRVVAFSGTEVDVDIIKLIWPTAITICANQISWDLMNANPNQYNGQLAMACNTFMSSTNPQRWLNNLSISGFSYLMIQDLSSSRRNSALYMAPETGDVQRYSISSHGIIGATDPGYEVFDLSKCGYDIIDVISYNTKFAALIDLKNQTVKHRMHIYGVDPV
jgi:hypothetical protein